MAKPAGEKGIRAASVRYNGTIHDFVPLNAIRNVSSTEAAIKQVKDGLRQYLEPVTKSMRRRGGAHAAAFIAPTSAYFSDF